MGAVAILIQNVVVMPYPTVIDDADGVSPGLYNSDSIFISKRIITGHDVQKMSSTCHSTRVAFEDKRDSAVNEIGGRPKSTVRARVPRWWFHPSSTESEQLIEVPAFRSTTSHCAISLLDVMYALPKFFRDHPATLKLTPVDLNTTTKGIGWQNKIALVGLMSVTMGRCGPMYDYLTAVTYCNTVAMASLTYNVWGPKELLDHIDDGVTVFESCFGSEIILSRYFIVVFAGSMIQKAVTHYQQYNPVDAVHVTADISRVLDAILRHDLLVTSGAGFEAYERDEKDFVGAMMTLHHAPWIIFTGNPTRCIASLRHGWKTTPQHWWWIGDKFQRLRLEIVQTMWLMALKKKPVMSHLVYMLVEDSDNPAMWFQKQMMVNAVVVGRPQNGEAWSLIPLLSALLRVHRSQELMVGIIAEMGTTMLSLLEVEGTSCSTHCCFGFKTLGINEHDDKLSMWRKLKPTFEQMMNETLLAVENVHEQMNAAVVPVIIPLEYVTDTRTSTIFPNDEPPQPLNAGLMRLSSKMSPNDQELLTLRKSLVCFDTLET
ncbi:TPA: LOW QUALITY PROTEIN: hypothetical protein N0F65_003264 [Lagenidium giganteum]|uniref:Uncharacterized protein n=1 Tax=Lagenidium giganteum TaxID=4803 RepID=A0AAV2YHC4_9STRA|nr:TPA: LOW QUALITY PROTEIN: hypothetical protein N0F65_003264 [Lagenidium giganteum]